MRISPDNIATSHTTDKVIKYISILTANKVLKKKTVIFIIASSTI